MSFRNKSILIFFVALLLGIALHFLKKCGFQAKETVIPLYAPSEIIDSTLSQGPSVVIYDSTRCYNGLTTVGRHFYIDMHGNETFRREGDLCYDFTDNQYFAFIDNGSLCSFVDNKISWELKINAHHELLFDDMDNILVLGTQQLLRYDSDTSMHLYHLFYKITPKGEILKVHSFGDTYQQIKKQLGSKLDEIRAKNIVFVEEQFGRKEPYIHSDMHPNSFCVIPKNELSDNIPAFQEGNYMFSCFYNNLLFILDQESFELLWYYVQEDSYLGQHSIKVDQKGNLSYFLNNLTAPNGDLYSAVRILNPLTKQVIWEFNGNPAYSIHSLTQGHYQFLPNKNLLVTINNRVLEDNGYGYVLEVDSNNNYVWKWTPENFEELAETREGFYRVERVIK